MDTFSDVPPGFRFHPTDEELVDYYLRKKVASKKSDIHFIKDVDLYKIEPWDLQELCKIGSDEQNDWFFFSHKDKKYPTGTRTNRATKAGFWKATGRDKEIYSKNCLIGMRKTLVFYKGRAPNGQKSDWIMHEYRLQTNENGTTQEEGWVVCKVFKKRMTATMRKVGEYDSPSYSCYDNDQVPFMQDEDLIESPISQISHNPYASYHQLCKPELMQEVFQYNNNMPHFLQLPQLESPKVPDSSPAASSVLPNNYAYNDNHINNYDNDIINNNNNGRSINNLQFSSSLTQEEHAQQYYYCHQQQNVHSNINCDQVTTDWRVLHKFVAAQLSHDEQDNGSKEYDASTSTSSCQNDLCK